MNPELNVPSDTAPKMMLRSSSRRGNWFLLAASGVLCIFCPISSRVAADAALVPGVVNAMPSESKALHDFDFLIGRWRVHHRQLKERLAGSNDWVEFDGTSEARKILGGQGNMDDNVLNVPGNPYRAVSLRAFDEKTQQWSIWWLDSRTPSAPLEPAVRGGFKNGVGEFYADDTFKGRAIWVRYIWSLITPTSCQWEQAFSTDRGKSWEVNWVMKFERLKEA